ncbi:hypothetical protein [Flavilitoribacter nigricans]|nr:hypothetical protein [Flavilitoribacter nigricans]
MSEFQLYQFKAVDRPLTTEEQCEVGSWSSRTQPTSTSATFSYAYGDFPKDEEKVVEEYFDIMLYLANWGSKRLMMRFPKKLVDQDAISKFLINADDSFTTHLALIERHNCFLLDFYWSDEEGGEWIDEEAYRVGEFVAIREGILTGDYRALYLFWLKLAAFKAQWEPWEGNEEDNLEIPAPPIPPNLKKMNGALKTLVDFFEIDIDLIAAAQQASTDTGQLEKNFKKLILQLPEKDRIDYLVRLAAGEINLDIKLRRQLETLDKSPTQPMTETLSISELLGLSTIKEKERQQEEARRAAEAHRSKMEKVAREEIALWQSVYENLELKTGRSYDLATATLRDLKELAVFRNDQTTFKDKMDRIKENYGKSRALMQRFDRNKLK